MRADLKEFISDEASQKTSEEEKLYAVSIGLAVGYHPQGLQFRVEEFFPKKQERKAGFYAFFLLCASFLITAGIVSFASYPFSFRKQEVKRSLEQELTRWNLSVDEEEPLFRLEKAVASHAKEPFYLSKFPKVAEAISWIYQHPIFFGEDPIEICEIHYQLVQYPTSTSPKNPFLAKIEMLIQPKSALQARKWHEALLQGDGWVDNTQEIQWEPLDLLYRVSFFLKNERPS